MSSPRGSRITRRLSFLLCLAPAHEHDQEEPMSPGPHTPPTSPPPYAPSVAATATNSVGLPQDEKLSPTETASKARITVIDDKTGQVLGFMAERSTRTCCFNVQYRGNALIFEVPRPGSDHEDLGRLRLMKPGADANDYQYVGIQIAHDADGSNERWTLRACDRGRPGAAFKGRCGVFPCSRHPGVGESASSCVWGTKQIDENTEELSLSWLQDDGARLPLMTVFDRTVAKYYPRVYARPAEGYELTPDEQKVRLILEPCISD